MNVRHDARVQLRSLLAVLFQQSLLNMVAEAVDSRAGSRDVPFHLPSLDDFGLATLGHDPRRDLLKGLEDRYATLRRR